MVRLEVGFVIRFHSHHQETVKIIRSGKLGTPVYDRVQLSSLHPTTLNGSPGQNLSRGRGAPLANLGGARSGWLEVRLDHMFPST